MNLDNKKNPLISICIPTYEMYGLGSKFLRHSFEILKKQTLKDFNIIITDNSKDSSISELCDEYKEILDIEYYKNSDPKSNAPKNLNNCIKKAGGRIIKILFQDDFLYSEKSLEEIAKSFDLEKDSWLVSACIHSRNETDFYKPFYPKYNRKIYLGKNTISSPSVLTIKNENPILFDENLIWLMDCDYYKRCYDKFGKPKILNTITVVNRTGEHQTTNTIATKSLRKLEFKYVKAKHKSRRKMTRTNIINSLIRKNNYKNYLEIGVNTPKQPGYNWSGIEIDLKHGVDPNVDTTFKMTSDEFFNQNNNFYDIIFIDGLHIFEQVYKDIINSLKFLNEGGTIVVHDCNPTREITQRRIRASNAWHGDVWKAILKLRIENPELSIYTVDADEGCAVIQKGFQKLFIPKKDEEEDIYTYKYFNKNRKDILNLISKYEFRKIVQKINLQNVTLFAVACTKVDQTIHALKKSMEGINFARAILLTHEPISLKEFGIEVINIEKLDYKGYNHFILYKVCKYIDTDFALLVQNDGYVLNPQKWNPDFFKYDYIGAPWDKDTHFTNDGKEVRVGNGGFSFRSKKILNIFNELNLPFTDNGTGFFHEDGVISVYHRNELEKNGIKIAPVEIASKFSREKFLRDSVFYPFGFHNKKNASKLAFLRVILGKIGIQT